METIETILTLSFLLFVAILPLLVARIGISIITSHLNGE